MYVYIYIERERYTAGQGSTHAVAEDTYLFGRRRFSAHSPKLPEELACEASPNVRPEPWEDPKNVEPLILDSRMWYSIA